MKRKSTTKDGRGLLPATASGLLATFAEGAGGRADDCFVTLTDPSGRSIGRLTLGWFREHTDLRDWEKAHRSVARDRAKGIANG
jgi:hypothetical protein